MPFKAQLVVLTDQPVMYKYTAMAVEETGGLIRDGFRCPLCQYDAYCRVIVLRADGSRYVTQFYRCGGCSVMFLNPHTFTDGKDAQRSRPRANS
jgi:hypothetical protein